LYCVLKQTQANKGLILYHNFYLTWYFSINHHHYFNISVLFADNDMCRECSIRQSIERNPIEYNL